MSISKDKIYDPALFQEFDYISCDIFDTLLFRLCKNPHDLFYEVAERMKNDGHLSKDCDSADFVSWRIYAEKKARSKSKHAECSMEEIAKGMAKVCDPAMLQKYELECELDFCYLNKPLADSLLKQHELGKKIIIISDIYHSSRVLVNLLKSSGFPVNIIKLFLSSSDEGYSKATGRLYEIAKTRLIKNTKRWLHIGDNYNSDIKNSQKAGGNALYIAAQMHSFEILQREAVFEEASARNSASLASLREICARNSVAYPKNLQDFYKVGALTFGPILSRYADACIDKCQELGIKKILCCTREAESFYPLLEKAIKAKEENIKLIPFYISRRAVSHSSLKNIGIFELVTLLASSKKTKSIRQHLEWLELPLDELREELKELDLDALLSDTKDFFHFANTLNSSHKIKQLLSSIGAKNSENFLEYFLPLISETEDGEEIFMADIGFKGTSQLFLNQILKDSQVNLKVSGYYLCLHAGASQHILDGESVYSYCGHFGRQKRETKAFSSHPEIMEQSIIGAYGSCVGYENGQPVLEKTIPSYRQLKACESVRQGIFDFQNLWLEQMAKIKAAGRSLSPSAYISIDRQNLAIIQRLFKFPLDWEISSVGSLYHDDNYGNNSGGQICSPEDELILLRESYNELKKLKSYWPQGLYNKVHSTEINRAFSIFSTLL